MAGTPNRAILQSASFWVYETVLKKLAKVKKTTFRGPGFVFWNQAPEISRTVFWVYETALNKNFSACEEIFSYLVASSVLAKICAEK